MANIYELNDSIKACIQLDEEHVVSVDDGEILNLQQFEALQMERDAKVGRSREGAWIEIRNTVGFSVLLTQMTYSD